ncbi:MAG: transglycosylase SLT domain-containing protein [Deltaproteobacteria bacterium]|nr:transglycosylase SLT domain-containing protein [Deltaproteobacteria bacterium]MCL5277066.1 transglycosylase SLT domain-containing protein [Deltaproteobacteria bacterium]
MLVFAVSVFLSCGLVKPALKERQNSIDDVINAVSAGRYVSAYKEMKSIDVSGMDDQQRTAVDFMGAFLGYKTGNYREAVSGFRELLRRQSGLQDYVNWYLANSYVGLGDFKRALPYLRTIAADYTESVFYTRSVELRARCLSALKLYGDARSVYAGYITMPSFYGRVPAMLAGIAALDMSMGDLRGGIENYAEVYSRFPASRYAAIAFSALAAVTDTSKLKIDHYQMARLLMSDGRYRDAVGHLRSAINEAPPGVVRDRTVQMYRDLGIAYFNTGRYNDAVRALRAAIRYDTAKRSYAEVLFWLGKSYLKLGQTDYATNTFVQVAYMDGTYAPMAMYRLSAIYGQSNDTGREKRWLVKLAGTNTPLALSAYWHLGWMSYTSGDFKEAIGYFKKLKGSEYSDWYDSMKADYWIAKTLLKQGRSDKANAAFFRIANSMPLGYYTVMANMWIGVNTLSYDPNSVDVAEPSHVGPGFAYHYSRYRLLKSLGMETDAMCELSSLIQSRLTPGEALLLCRELYANGDYYHSLSVARLRLGDMLQTFTGAAVPVWYYSYPSGYAYIIKNYADRYGLDPVVVYSIILQESKYKPDAVSGSGALGIMQIMPFTGARIARDISLIPFSVPMLLDPQINIGIGIWYFKQLMVRYKGNYVLSLAAYNAGTKAVDKWLAASDACNTDEFIEEIPFDETRHYVKAIIADIAAYTMVYGGDFSLGKHIYMEGSFLKGCGK